MEKYPIELANLINIFHHPEWTYDQDLIYKMVYVNKIWRLVKIYKKGNDE